MRFESVAYALLFYRADALGYPHALLAPYRMPKERDLQYDYNGGALLSEPTRSLGSVRRKHRLFGASKNKEGSWRSFIGDRMLDGNLNNSPFLDTLSEVIEIDPSGGRNLQTDAALQVCKIAVPLEEQVGNEYGTVCSCNPNPIQRTAMLECKDTKCAYCNNEETVCTGYSYGVLFDRNGEDIEYFEEDAYTKGRSGTIRYTETDETCTVTVAGTECNQCVLEECGDGYYGINVSCGNIEEGASYSSCQEGFSTSGIFEAYNAEEFGYCYTTFDICQRSADGIENRYDCSCNVDPTNSEGFILSCDDRCEYCNDLLSVCGEETYKQTFNDAAFTGSIRTVSYTSGRSERVTYEEYNCDASGGCRDCQMKVDGVSCDRCSIKVCPDGNRAPEVSCDNIDDTLSDIVDFCSSTSLSGSVLAYFEEGFTESCSSKKEMACREAKSEYESHKHQFACRCVDLDNEIMELQCEATCGDLCNDEASVCVREAIYEDYGEEGVSSYFRKDIQYTVGRKESISYVEYVDGLCSMTIDGVECQSCALKDCPGNPKVDRAPTIDCTQFDGGAVLDLCEPELHIDTGIFERFSVAEFQECMDRTPANGVCETSVHLSNLPQTTTGTTLLIPYDGSKSCGSTQSFAPGLWYTVVGNGSGIEASLCDSEADFTAHISIYAGSGCNNRECIAASEENCKISWFGEKNIKYHVRVHGIGAQVGNFGLLMTETNWGTIECRESKTMFEMNPELTTTCEDCEDPDKHGHVHLHCTVGCTTCDETGSVCANRTESSTFDKGSLIHSKSHYQFTMGRSEYLTIEKSECTSPINCDECQVTIGGEVCESCDIVECSNEASSQGIEAICGNSTVNTCQDVSSPSDGATDNVLNPLVDSNYDQCFSRDAAIACQDHKKFQQNLNEDVLCDCESVGDTGDVRLVCQRHDCLRCNPERTLCGFDALGSIFDGQLGRLSETLEGFQFVVGRSDLVAFHQGNDMSSKKTQNDNTTCSMSVNGNACDTCIAKTCPEDDDDGPAVGLYHGITFDCQNINGGLFYDGCSRIQLPGAFEFLNAPSYESCVDIPGSPQDICEDALMDILTNINDTSHHQESCDCHGNDNGGYELICTDADDCHICADHDELLCGNYTEYRTEWNPFGLFVAHIDTYQYDGDDDDLLLVVRGNQVECQVSINGELCSTCHYVDCPDMEEGNSQGMNYYIDCSNLLFDMDENRTTATSRTFINTTTSLGGTEETSTTTNMYYYHCGQGTHDIFTVLSNSSHYICESDTSSPSSIPSDGPSTMPSQSPTPAPTIATTSPTLLPSQQEPSTTISSATGSSKNRRRFHYYYVSSLAITFFLGVVS